MGYRTVATVQLVVKVPGKLSASLLCNCVSPEGASAAGLAGCPVLCRAHLTLALQMLEARRPQAHASSAEQTQSSSQSCCLSCPLRVTPIWVGSFQ